MKKLSYLLGLFLVAGFMFVSCNDDDDTEPQELKPVITFQTGPTYTSSDVTLTQGESILIGVVCTANANSSAKLTNFKIYFMENNNTIPTNVDTTFNSASFTYAWTIPFNDVFDGKLYAEITDKDGEKASQSFNILVEASAGPIYTYTAILMGGQTNPNAGSFYSTGEDQVYEVIDLTNNANNQKKIDLVFFYGTTNEYSLGAPNDDQVAIAHEANGIADWTNKNATKFNATAIIGLNWADVIDDGLILDNAVNLTGSLTNHLLTNQIYAFETASNSTNPSKKGLFKIIETMGTSGADRAIKIEVKIQQ